MKRRRSLDLRPAPATEPPPEASNPPKRSAYSLQPIEKKVAYGVAAGTPIALWVLSQTFYANKDVAITTQSIGVCALAGVLLALTATFRGRIAVIATAFMLSITAFAAGYPALALMLWITLRIGKTQRQMREAGELPPPRWARKREKSDTTDVVAPSTSKTPPKPSKRYTPPARSSKRPSRSRP